MTTITERVRERLAHRAGPVEQETAPNGQRRAVQRCLRCDGLVSVEGLDPRFPRPLGERVAVGSARCPGTMRP